MTFKGNKAERDGGAINFVKHSTVSCARSTGVKFYDNGAIGKGGAAYISNQSSVFVNQLSSVKFY